MEVIFGLAFLLFLIYMFVGTISVIIASFKPRKRKSRIYDFQKNDISESRRAQQSYNLIKNSPFSLKYEKTGSSETNVVYLIRNDKLGALKIGVGQLGRVLQLVNSTTSRNSDGQKVGWEVLRLAYFADMKQAYLAESKVLFHWRNQLNLSIFLSANQMGFAHMKLGNSKVWVYTGGHTETVNSSEICKLFTWELVTKSTGFLSETIGDSDEILIHQDCEYLHKFNASEFQRRKRKSRAKREPRVKVTFENQEERFWSKISKVTEEPHCWVWNSGTTNGYGIGHYEEKLELVHRITWRLLKGEIPPKSCGVRNCVNPEHWFIELSQEYECTNVECNRKSETTTRPGLCKTCRQREKRKRRKEKQNNLEM
jgi:hypothetical protein